MEEGKSNQHKKMSIERSIIRLDNSILGQTQSLNVDSSFNTSVNNGKETSRNTVAESDMNRSPFLPPEKLAELARTDPKKVKRIIANRKSASKSKERKKFHENELQIKVKNLQSQVDNVSQQLLVTKRDVTTRIAWNSTLRLKINAKRQELSIRRAKYEALKNEVEYYKMKTNQFAADMANNPSYHDMVSKFSSGLSLQHEHPMQSQISLPPSPFPFGQPSNDEHFGSDFVDFNVFD
ncbi:hypothetical protein Lal_00006377 [Lupinus albus]|nr:hypothetical protein Lal_00006377 [Lupinus albus]